jgi:hypothetical protein
MATPYPLYTYVEYFGKYTRSSPFGTPQNGYGAG